MYCNLTDGRKIGMPRYYKNKIYSEEQRQEIGQATLIKLREKKQRKIDTDPHYHHNLDEQKYYSFRKQKDDKSKETL